MAINSILLPDSQRSYYGSKQDQWRKVWWQTNSSPPNVSQNEKAIKQTKKWFNMTNTHSWGGITLSFTGSGKLAESTPNISEHNSFDQLFKGNGCRNRCASVSYAAHTSVIALALFSLPCYFFSFSLYGKIPAFSCHSISQFGPKFFIRILSIASCE